jgi:hypothetical protein
MWRERTRMKRVVVAVREPKNVAGPSEDGQRLRFPFAVVPEDKVGKPDERNHTSEHQITVKVPDTISAPWRESGADVSLILFEAGRRRVEKLCKSGELQQSLDLELRPPEYTGSTVPFDTSLIPNPAGFRMIVEVSPTIGF